MDELVDDTGAPQAGGPIFAETRDQNMPKGGIKKGTGGRPFLVPLFSKKRSIFRGGGYPVVPVRRPLKGHFVYVGRN